MDDNQYVRAAAKFIAELERIHEEVAARPIPDFDEMLNRSSLGSPVAKHLQEQGEEIIRRIKSKESGED